MQNLLNKRILLIAPHFFGYEEAIIQELKSRGALVDYLPDRPFETPFMKAVTKIMPSWVQIASSRLYRRRLSSFGASHYDYIFIINGQTVSYDFLKSLRSDFPGAKSLLYLWDSIDNRPQVAANLPLYDEAFTFDPECSVKHGMQLRPLFFSKGFGQNSKAVNYQLSFIGTAHSDRYAVINRLKKTLAKDVRAFWYLYLQAPWVFYLYRIIKPFMRNAQKEEFHFLSLDKHIVQSVFMDSKAIVDIEHPNQRGLTMRTFEAIGAGKKLITTNQFIVEYDFYATGNICVIDRVNPQIPAGFLESPVTPYPDNMLYRYSLAGWVDEIFDFDQKGC